MKAKPNRIYKNKDGYEIEEEWIEKYQDWLMIRVDDLWESNCEYINILTRRHQWYLIIIILNKGFHKDERRNSESEESEYR